MHQFHADVIKQVLLLTVDAEDAIESKAVAP